jgi:hypothetical protein
MRDRNRKEKIVLRKHETRSIVALLFIVRACEQKIVSGTWESSK